MENKTEQQQAAQQEQKENLRPVHIVIIEDHPNYRNAIATNLSLFGPKDGLSITTRGYSSYTAEDREHIMSEVPEIVLIDLELPDGPSGVEASRQLRSEGYQGKIVFLTGYSADEVSGTSRQWRGDGLIEKTTTEDTRKAIFSYLK